MADTTTSGATAQKEHNAYLPGYKPSHIAHHTWRTAENSAQYLIPTLQAMAQEKPNLRLLDCGTGPGTIAASFSKYMPKGTITATDISEEVLKQAATHAAAEGITNMHCQAASIYDLPFADGEFDIVHAQQVLCHLDAPLEALRSMLRVCKSGGIVALRECDMRMWCLWPELPWLLESHKMALAVMEAVGGSNNMGSRLVSLALQAGVRREKIQASMGTWCYATREEREMWGGVHVDRLRNGAMRKTVLEKGLGWSEGEIEEMARAWEEWVAAEDGCCGIMHGEVIVRKP